MRDLLDEAIFLFLKSSIPAAYLISNKTVLTLHNFRFPSIFLSWQLAIAILGLLLFYRKSFAIGTLAELRYYLTVAGVQTVALYFGSRSLAILPVPVFIAGQIIGLYFLHSVNRIRYSQPSPLWVCFHCCNLVLILPLFVMICIEYSEGILLQFIVHVVAHATLNFLTLPQPHNANPDLTARVKGSVVTFGCTVLYLVVYGSFSREILTAARFDFSHTHFRVYLGTSGALCALAAILRLSADESDLGHRYTDVLQYTCSMVLGYLYEYNGNGVREHGVCLYFILLLLTSKQLHCTSKPGVTSTVEL